MAGPKTCIDSGAGHLRWPKPGAHAPQRRHRQAAPLSPQEGWLSDGRQVLDFQRRRYERCCQSLEVTFGEVMNGSEPPLEGPEYRARQ